MSNKSQLRDEDGSLIGGLDVLEYNKGIYDYENKIAPPELTSTSYDLGRQRAAENKSSRQAVDDYLKRRDEQTRVRMKEILPPDAYAEYIDSLEAIKPKTTK